MYSHPLQRSSEAVEKNSKHFVFVYILRNISYFKDKHDAFSYFLLRYIINVNKIDTFNIKY